MKVQYTPPSEEYLKKFITHTFLFMEKDDDVCVVCGWKYRPGKILTCSEYIMEQILK